MTHADYMGVLAKHATRSDDPHTQTACLIVGVGGYFTVAGVNSLPDGIIRKDERLVRANKYRWIQHAETNAIATAARLGKPTFHATMYLNWFPCADCASAIVQAGITEIHVSRQRYEEREGDPNYHFAEAAEKLIEAGVEIVWH